MKIFSRKDAKTLELDVDLQCIVVFLLEKI